MRSLLLAASVALTGCAVTVQPVAIESPTRLEPIKSQVENSKSIFVANVAAKMIEKRIGQIKRGTLCVGGDDLIWRDAPPVLNTIRETVSETLSKNGYHVYSGLIQANGERDADVLIGVAVEDVRANICYSINGMKGEASLRLRLEVFDNSTRKSVTVSASGASSIAEFSRTGDPDLFVQAAEMAAKNAFAQEAFFRATRK